MGIDFMKIFINRLKYRSKALKAITVNNEYCFYKTIHSDFPLLMYADKDDLFQIYQ